VTPRGRFAIRPADTDDAGAMAALYASADAGFPGEIAGSGGIARLLQTGNAFLVAELDGHIAGAIRHGQSEGIAWLDLLVSVRPFAGAALLQAVEGRAQDQGIRLVHGAIRDGGRVEVFFARHGYVPFSRERDDAGNPLLRLERRLPLLTVREQRRSDAAAIGAITGEDTWMLEQHALPGWFVASDGEKVVGAITVSDAGGGKGRISAPALLDSYRGRGLEVWMLERASIYAETGGYHTLTLAAVATLEPLKRDLEDRRWFRDGEVYVKRLAAPPTLSPEAD
jgi:GNAT superfamily N-acetyltransferase